MNKPTAAPARPASVADAIRAALADLDEIAAAYRAGANAPYFPERSVRLHCDALRAALPRAEAADELADKAVDARASLNFLAGYIRSGDPVTAIRATALAQELEAVLRRYREGAK